MRMFETVWCMTIGDLPQVLPWVQDRRSNPRWPGCWPMSGTGSNWWVIRHKVWQKMASETLEGKGWQDERRGQWLVKVEWSNERQARVEHVRMPMQWCLKARQGPMTMGKGFAEKRVTRTRSGVVYGGILTNRSILAYEAGVGMMWMFKHGNSQVAEVAEVQAWPKQAKTRHFRPRVCLILTTLSVSGTGTPYSFFIFLTVSDCSIVHLVRVIILSGTVTWPCCLFPELPLLLMPHVLCLAVTSCFRQSTPFHLGHFNYPLPIFLFTPHKLST